MELKREKIQREEARKKERDLKLKELENELDKERQRDLQREQELEKHYTQLQEKMLTEKEALHLENISEQEREVIIISLHPI